MSNQSIREVFNKYANFKAMGIRFPTDGKLPPGIENMCCEIYNKGDEEITFTSVHPEWAKMAFFGKDAAFWYKFSCKPGEWVFLPHSQYIWTVPSGDQEYQVVINVGDAMFKGNKLPSRPEVQKTRIFQ